ncbi:MAG: hypothetical protein ACXAB7_21510, partial [Candidatus Kariarchaeaceae archaeon]
MVFSITYALKSIARRKQKNLITAIAIALGVALFIGTQAGSDGVFDTVTKINLEELGEEDIRIFDPTSSNGMFSSEVPDYIQSLINAGSANLQGIETISERITFSGTVYASGAFEKNVGIRAINPDETGFGEFSQSDNTPISLPTILVDNRTIVSNTLSDEMELGIGDNILISVPDGTGNSTTITLTVATIY